MELKNKKQNNIYTKLVGYFTKNGKKNKSASIIIKALTNASTSGDDKSIGILQKIAFYLGVVVEIRSLRMRRNVYTVPVPVNASRRNYLIVKKLSKVLNASGDSLISTEAKLTQELLGLLKSKTSKSVAERDLVLVEAEKNKSNTHFRW